MFSAKLGCPHYNRKRTPRLELCVAVLAVNVDTTMKEALNLEVNESFLWTDRMSVLQYVANTQANRVSTIKQLSTPASGDM